MIHDDRLLIYYTGINTTHGAAMPFKRISIGLASWRLDGFVSLAAQQAGGVVETNLLHAAGDTLEVNVETPNASLYSFRFVKLNSKR